MPSIAGRLPPMLAVSRFPPARAFVLLCLTTQTFSPTQAFAATLEVGPDREFKLPSDAAKASKDGDTVEIAKGEYFDCAVWRSNRLVISGKEAGVVITDKTCLGKGIFVTAGNDITIRNLTLTRARVPDHNGAGIRAEGTNLTLDHVRLINNENGILTNDNPRSTLRVIDSEFVQNGRCADACAHGLYAGHIAELDIEHTRFFETKEGHHIKSRAAKTVLIADDIEDGPKGTASYLVEIPNGGTLIMEDDVLEKGPDNQNHGAAIMIGAEGVTQPTRELTFKNVRFTNDYSGQTLFVNNMTATPVMISGATFGGKVRPLDGDGEIQ